MINNLLENLIKEDLFQPFSEEEFAEYVLRNCTRNPDGTYDCKGSVYLMCLGLTKLPIRFRRVEGSFNCSGNQLTTLEGAPEWVGKHFICFSNNLTTLEGGPRYVGTIFDCAHNLLTTLKGAPRWVGEDFNCASNELRTLEGAPEYVGGKFICSDNPVPEEELKKTVKRSYLK